MAENAMTVVRDGTNRRSQAGFTMIEVMVSILLTAIAASGVMALYMIQTRASGFSRHSTEAAVLVQDEMEQLRTSTTTGTATVASLNERGKVVSGGLFTRTYTVTTGAGFDEMVVSVSWTEDGVAKTVTMRSRRNQ